MTLTFVRWKPDSPRKGKKTAPLEFDHPLYYTPCPLCTNILGGHGELRLVVAGPASDEDWDRHQRNEPYGAQALVLHDKCVGEDVVVLRKGHRHTLENLDCPRCHLSLQVEVLQPIRGLRVGPAGEVLGLHSPCLGIAGENGARF